MRQFSVFAICAVMVSCPAFSQEASSIAYVPAKDGKPAQTVRLPSGEPQAVIESEKGDRPEQCPQEAFWEVAGSPGELVNCGEGSVYEIQPFEATVDSKYVMRLVQSSKSKPGTNDPGSSKKPVSPPEVTP